MKKLINIVALTCVGLAGVSCDDVFEEDISDDIIVTTSPVEGSTIVNNAVQLRWDAIEGTENYRLQVEESALQERFLDSLITGTSFVLNLDPGSYIWRVRGENFGYETAYSKTASFEMEASDDLSNQTIFPNSPSQDYYTNETIILLSWSKIQAATSYDLEIDRTVSGNTITVLQTPDLTVTSQTIDQTIISEDGIYTWKVKGVNETSSTDFSSRRIFIDTEVPASPNLIAPINDERTTNTVSFSWNISADNGIVKSSVSSVLEIASDIGFTNIIKTYRTTNMVQENIFDSDGEYYWRVKAVDDAGNESITYSEVRKITIL